MSVCMPGSVCTVCRVSAAHWLCEDGRGAERLGAPPWEFVKTFQQSHGTRIIGNSRSGPARARRPPHFPLRVVTLSGSLGSAWEAPREKLCSRQEKERKSRTDKETQPLTMKPVFMLLVSTAWTLTGAQYYYQGLMDYLENRLLAIEVRKTNLHSQYYNISPFFVCSLNVSEELSRKWVKSFEMFSLASFLPPFSN